MMASEDIRRLALLAYRRGLKSFPLSYGEYLEMEGECGFAPTHIYGMKIEISGSFGLLDRCKGRDESKEQPS
jgi:hypothetical protein